MYQPGVELAGASSYATGMYGAFDQLGSVVVSTLTAQSTVGVTIDARPSSTAHVPAGIGPGW